MRILLMAICLLLSLSSGSVQAQIYNPVTNKGYVYSYGYMNGRYYYHINWKRVLINGEPGKTFEAKDIRGELSMKGVITSVDYADASLASATVRGTALLTGKGHPKIGTNVTFNAMVMRYLPKLPNDLRGTGSIKAYNSAGAVVFNTNGFLAAVFRVEIRLPEQKGLSKPRPVERAGQKRR